MDTKKYKVIITPTAFRELDRIYTYISEELYAKNAAKDLMRKIESEIKNLSSNPKIYPKIEKIDELKPYGVFAVPAINNMENKNITRGISENNNSDMMKLVKYEDSFKLDSNEIEFLDNYLK